MRVLLIHPEISRTKYNFAGVIDNEPLDLEYIAALLVKEGIEYDIWDGQIETIKAQAKIDEYKPDVVYCCGRTRQENFMLEYLSYSKKTLGAVTIAGGVHTQLCRDRFYKDDVDFVLSSYDYFALIKVIKGESPVGLNGICYKEDGKWVGNTVSPVDIGLLPHPDRTYFNKNSSKYRYLELVPCAHVRTAYSCPYGCAFCARRTLNAGKYRARDIKDVVDEIEEIPYENIYFIDDDFLFDPERIREFIRLVRERNIQKKYVCYGRADFISKNEELMAELKSIGLYYVLTGLESTKDNYLESYNKKIDMNGNIKAIEITNRLGIHMMGMFITDLDFEAKDFREIYKFAKSHSLKHVAISIYTPEIDSEVYKGMKNRIITDNPADYDYLHVVAKPGKLSLKSYYFHYHVLMVRLFLRAYKDGIYSFLDYGYYVKSILKNMFKFGG